MMKKIWLFLVLIPVMLFINMVLVANSRNKVPLNKPASFYDLHPYFDPQLLPQYEAYMKSGLSPFESINHVHYELANPAEALFPDQSLILVNQRYVLTPDYIPKGLVLMKNINFVIPGDYERNYLVYDAYLALKQLIEAGKKEGANLYVLSGYRSYERQESIYNRLILEDYSNALLSAKPGSSEHQTGLSVDLTCSRVAYQLTPDFKTTVEGRFLQEHAHEFGFIIRYPEHKTEITGYLYEPWHLRYVGVEHSQIIYKEKLTLEEYILKYIPIPKPKPL